MVFELKCNDFEKNGAPCRFWSCLSDLHMLLRQDMGIGGWRRPHGVKLGHCLGKAIEPRQSWPRWAQVAGWGEEERGRTTTEPSPPLVSAWLCWKWTQEGSRAQAIQAVESWCRNTTIHTWNIVSVRPPLKENSGLDSHTNHCPATRTTAQPREAGCMLTSDVAGHAAFLYCLF